MSGARLAVRLRAPLRGACAAALAAVALAGCGLGAGEKSGDARILVTRDFGARTLGAQIEQNIPESETAMRLTERAFDVRTTYGGKFVQSIDGLAGGGSGGKADWFYWVNGIVGEESAADFELHGGDRVWWDYHDWSGSQNVNAVVGQFPEPFAHGAEGKRYPVVIQCAKDSEEICQQVSQQLSDVGTKASRQTLGTNVETEVLRVMVGRWQDLRRDQALRLIDKGPTSSGVFARFDEDGRTLELLDAQGRTARAVGAGAGLVAAVKLGEQVPTWTVTGTDLDGVAAAADALVPQRLRQRFALATDPAGDDVGLPLLR
ncbi:DUF4430 domain-containing protein [Conexibacter arvalis]|uniref:Transcobalamin-like C-terminal domain-containing protein n=1 Tax=Conexibacter arvalis TaxID=912552 RepID=A0A840IID0_9ACTN|nr:DUF4430 domain-containing protein [Conexibacter arvalis]MBB4664742.1 hypothetical protein [Conexibacter arvalis]